VSATKHGAPAASTRSRSKVVERVIVQEHDVNECVRRVKASPGATRYVLYEVVGLIDAEILFRDPKWERALRAVEALQDSLHRRGGQAVGPGIHRAAHAASQAGSPGWTASTRRRHSRA